MQVYSRIMLRFLLGLFSIYEIELFSVYSRLWWIGSAVLGWCHLIRTLLVLCLQNIVTPILGWCHLIRIRNNLKAEYSCLCDATQPLVSQYSEGRVQRGSCLSDTTQELVSQYSEGRVLRGSCLSDTTQELVSQFGTMLLLVSLFGTQILPKWCHLCKWCHNMARISCLSGVT